MSYMSRSVLHRCVFSRCCILLSVLRACLAQPDLRFIPTKYHKFVMPSVRRVYLEAGPQDASSSSSTDPNTELKEYIATLEARVSSLTRDKSLLMDRCEMTLSASGHHAQKERVARLQSDTFRMEVDSLKRQLRASKFESDGYKAKCEILQNKVEFLKDR